MIKAFKRIHIHVYRYVPDKTYYLTLFLVSDVTQYEINANIVNMMLYIQLQKGKYYNFGKIWVRRKKDFDSVFKKIL